MTHLQMDSAGISFFKKVCEMKYLACPGTDEVLLSFIDDTNVKYERE